MLFILWKTVTFLECENSHIIKNDKVQDHLQVDVKVIIHACIHIPHIFSGFNLANDLRIATYCRLYAVCNYKSIYI